jgi:hypothetical protein
VAEGLQEVLEALINRPQYVFDCNESRFTVAALVGYRSSDNAAEWLERFITLRDDHQFGDVLTPKLRHDSDLKGSLLDLQKALQRCFNDNTFVCEPFTYNGVNLSIAASPIPQVCETTQANGILLFVTRCGHKCPPDVAITLRIFGRIVANWLAKYSECVLARFEAQRALRNPAPRSGPPMLVDASNGSGPAA